MRQSITDYCPNLKSQPGARKSNTTEGMDTQSGRRLRLLRKCNRHSYGGQVHSAVPGKRFPEPDSHSGEKRTGMHRCLWLVPCSLITSLFFNLIVGIISTHFSMP